MPSHKTDLESKRITARQQGAAPDRLQLRSLVPRSLRLRRRVSLVVVTHARGETGAQRFLMSTQIAPEKPEFGSPCNGCGFCCAAEPCGIAQEFLGAMDGPCPAMQFDEGRFWCGLVRTPGRYLGTKPEFDALISRTVVQALGVGRGCDSD